MVWQDCRGSHGSDGSYDPHVHDADDGADTVAWILEQHWCEDNVGSYGTSYLGMVQWATARAAPAGLKAIAPTAASADPYLVPWYSCGGARNWHMIYLFGIGQVAGFEAHAVQSGKGDHIRLTEAMAMANDPEPHMARLPMIDQPLLRQTPW